MSILFFLCILTAVIAPVLWLYGELAGHAAIRRTSAVAMTLSWTAVAVAGMMLATLPKVLDSNTRWTGAICDFVNAADDRLEAGEVDRVRTEFARFESGEFHETYETGWFLERLEQSTGRLQDNEK